MKKGTEPDWQAFIPGDFQGVARLREKGRIVFERAYGYADLPNRRKNTLNTRFQTASAGKAFVAAGILRMVADGQLSLQSRLREILDRDWGAVDPRITVEQLLTHTSGMPDYFDESLMGDYAALWAEYPNYKIRSNEDLLPLFVHKPMMFEAGTRFVYNNAGYAVLAMMLEAVGGDAFDRVLQRLVFVPCDMENTGYYELDRLPGGCADAYIWDREENSFYTNIYSVDAKGTGAGGAFTTVGDVGLFWDGLLGGKILPPPLAKEMLRMHSGGGDAHYGYGMWLEPNAAGGWTPHFEGCDPGVSFWSSHDLENGREITLVSNFGQNVWAVKRAIQAAWDALIRE